MKANLLNTNALAFIGDAVYEVYIRDSILGEGNPNVDILQKRKVNYVKAGRQAKALKEMMNGFLSEEEMAIAKRARNHKTTSKPKNADPIDYKNATAFEALIGYLHLEGKEERVKEIVEKAIVILSEAKDL